MASPYTARRSDTVRECVLGPVFRANLSSVERSRVYYRGKEPNRGEMGLTGLEPVTLRLSSACSNQLSYRPVSAASPPDFGFAIADFRFGTTGAQARIYKISNRQS